MGAAEERLVEGSPEGRVPLVRSLTLALLLVMLGLVKYGLGSLDAFPDYRELALAWQESGRLPATAGYAGYSPTTFILLGTLGLTSESGFWVGNMLLHALAVGLPVMMPQVRRNSVTQGIVFTFIAGGAILPSLTFWIGSYDSVIVIAAAVAALARNRWIRGVAWALLAFQHTPIAGISLVLWVVLQLVHRRSGRAAAHWLDVGLAVGGVLLGSVAIQLLANVWGVTETRADYMEAVGVATIGQMFWTRAWLVVFGVLGVGWFVLLDHRVRGAALTRATLACALSVGLVLPHLVLDAVRVPALVMLVPVFTWIRLAPDVFDQATLVGIRKLYLPIAVILPVVLVWEGATFFPGWIGLMNGNLRIAFGG